MKQTIEIPEGFELKKVSDTEYQIVKKEVKLPNTWEEFCRTYKVVSREYFISSDCTVACYGNKERDFYRDRNLLPNEQYGKAVLALIQLIQLRDCYRQGWKPNWDNTEIKYIIRPDKDTLFTEQQMISIPFTFSFQTAELRDKFFNNFKELLITATYLWK